MIDGIKALRELGFDDSKAIRLTGGDINDVFQIESRVIKVNSGHTFPSMLPLEADALELLSPFIRTPKVHNYGESAYYQFLELEYIPSGSKTTPFWIEFGEKLAHLHQQSANQFGLDFDNYIGSLRQSNTQKNTWEEFLIDERLQPMVEMAVNNGDVNYVEAKIFDRFYNRINELIPIEPPSLIHGDLWGGNYIAASNGDPVLIDPAVYYGHREMDIAMMHLFGGFDSHLFIRYYEVFPLDKGWEDRIKINQLYPLMVHVNLFGRSYWEQVHNILQQFA
jgi:protein-ribulosamine 3-kinase